MIAQMTVFFAPRCPVDIAVRLAHADQRETGDPRERARGVDQIGDLSEPTRVLLSLEAASLLGRIKNKLLNVPLNTVRSATKRGGGQCR